MATTENTTPSSAGILVGIIPTGGAQAQTTGSAVDDPDPALQNEMMATKLKVGLAIVPALFVFLIVSFYLVGRKRRVRPRASLYKDARTHVLPCTASDIIPARPRPPPRAPSDDFLAGATFVKVSSFGIDTLIRPLPAAHV